MKEIMKANAGTDNFRAILVKGHILEANDRERASVYSSGRGNRQRIDTKHHSWTNAWIRSEHGNEFEATFLSTDPSVREGHQIALLFLQKNEGPLALFGVENQTSGRFSFRKFDQVRAKAGFKAFAGINGILGILSVFGGGLAGLYLGTTHESWLLGLGVPLLSLAGACWASWSLDKMQGVHDFQKLGREIIMKAQSNKSFNALEAS